MERGLGFYDGIKYTALHLKEKGFAHGVTLNGVIRALKEDDKDWVYSEKGIVIAPEEMLLWKE